MKCTNCKHYEMDCKNPEVSFKFLDEHNWGVNAANDCEYFDSSKVIVELKDIDYGVPNTEAVATVIVGSVEFRVPIFNSHYDEGYYCIFPGENKSKSGFKYYNISILTGLSSKQNQILIRLIKNAIVNIHLYFKFEKEFDQILDDDYEMEFKHFIFSAKKFFKELEEECPF